MKRRSLSPSSPNHDTLTYLYGLQHRGIRLGLRSVRLLLHELGDPQKSFPSVHLAGTNGKGSTSAFLASMFMEAGLRTGLYTSPHLLRFGERIRIDGEEIPDERLVAYVRAMRRKIDALHATFFEATTAVAFKYFADSGVDVAVVETGLGGRFDATNVLRPMLSLITSIGLDHTEMLGGTLPQIAREKGGIIKPRTPVIVGRLPREASEVLRRIASNKAAPFFESWRTAGFAPGTRNRSGLPVFRTGMLKGSPLRLGLEGAFQMQNGQLAVAAATLVGRMQTFAPDFAADAVKRGLLNVRKNTGIRGRCERVAIGGLPYLIDVGHNPDGVGALVHTLKKDGIKPAVVVFGAMRDKDIAGMLAIFRTLECPIVAVAPEMARAKPSVEVLQLARNQGIQAEACPSVGAGVAKARKLAGKRTVLISGSHYVAAEALQFLEPQKP